MARIQEAGLLLVILILGIIFTVVGHFQAEPGKPNPFLNVDNLVNFIATPMSIYAIMAVGPDDRDHHRRDRYFGRIDLRLAGLGTAGVLAIYGSGCAVVESGSVGGGHLRAASACCADWSTEF